MRGPVIAKAVLFAVVVLAAFPSTALGSLVFVHHEFPGAIYDGASGEANELTVSETAGTVTVIDPGAVITVGSGCVKVSDHEATCAGVTSFFALLGDRNDSSSALVQDQLTSMIFYGDTGSDHLTLCSSCDGQLHGEGGSDILQGGDEGSYLAGGLGSDRLTGGAGFDFIYGEAGADVAAGRAGRDSIGGGPGMDELRGNRGNDRLRSRDGFRDFVRGGRGFDRARVDQLDVLQSIERRLS